MNQDNMTTVSVSSKPDARIDKFTFFGVLVILLGVTLPLLFFPEQGAYWVNEVKRFVTDKLGNVYLAFGVVSVIFVLYISFSDIGNIKLGKPEDEIEFKTSSWAAMMFCGGIGGDILYWSVLEWSYYYQGPPFGVEAGTAEAIKWASTYGIFHWGPVAWSIYLVPAVSIAYFAHVRNSPVLKVSQSLMPLFGEKLSKSNWGRLVDIFFIFGMIGGGATSLGLAAPLITQGMHELFGTSTEIGMQLFVLLMTTALFAYSAYQGLKSGIQKLSNINLYLAIAFLLFVICVGPTTFMFNAGLEGIGRSLSNMVEMMTWTEAFGEFGQFGFKDTNFPGDWTVFYWAWWLVFAPTIGLFIAKISKGRTIRQMALGSIFFGSLGCAFFFVVLGNYGLYTHLSGQLDVISLLNTEGATPTIFAILHTLPMDGVVIAIFTALALIFSATTFDSISYILASVVQHEVDDEPIRWNRLFWAFTLCLMPATIMFMGDLSTLQTASIFAGAPLLLIMALMMISTIKATRYDLHYQPDYSLSTIHIEEIPEVAPWEEGETSEAPEGSVHAQEAEYEEIRKQQESEDSPEESISQDS